MQNQVNTQQKSQTHPQKKQTAAHKKISLKTKNTQKKKNKKVFY